MDDNKMLTLVSQERIPLTPSMRLILEVAHLKYATPATVSRGGVLFINEFDVGWRPYYESWMSKFKAKNDEAATTTFTLNLSHYCDDSFIDDVRRRPTIAPMCLMAYFQSLTTIIDFMYDELKTEKVYSEFIKKLKDGSDPEISKLGTFDEAIKLNAPFMIISKSGGARMMEAGYSLMQMAKVSGKLGQLAEKRLPYVSFLTDPTTGGVTASFAMLGDINIAEPGALIGFAGPRVVKETIGRDLPEGFQTSEFVLEHGFLDYIVDRTKLKETVGLSLTLFRS